MVKNLFSKKESTFTLNKASDFDSIFELYPWALDVALRSDSISDAAQQIAKYIDRNSTVISYVCDTVSKSEEEPKKPKQSNGLKVESLSSFSDDLKAWSEKRVAPPKHVPRDTTFVPDNGRQRDPKLDIDAPVTLMEKLKHKIKELG